MYAALVIQSNGTLRWYDAHPEATHHCYSVPRRKGQTRFKAFTSSMPATHPAGHGALAPYQAWTGMTDDAQQDCLRREHTNLYMAPMLEALHFDGAAAGAHGTCLVQRADGAVLTHEDMAVLVDARYAMYT